jgi:hypothetical protein
MGSIASAPISSITTSHLLVHGVAGNEVAQHVLHAGSLVEL